MKTTYILTFAVLLAVAMMASVSAAGVGWPYMEGNTLRLQPGEISSVKFTFQNLGTTDDMTFKASISQGSEVASFIGGNNYVVPANTADRSAFLKISIPENAVVGTKYQVTVMFAQAASGAGIGINVGTGMEISFNVMVEAPQPAAAEQPAIAPISTTAWVVGAVIVVAIILWLALRKKKKK